MKHFLPLFMLLLLYSCSATNEVNTLTETQLEPQTDVKSFPLTSDEAEAIAENLIDSTTNIIGSLWEYEGENPTDDIHL